MDARTLNAGERQWRATLTLLWPAGLAGAPFLLSLGNVPLCMFRQLSGQPCPLCGGTHACAALAEGNFAQAWVANPGLMPLLAIAAVHAAQLAYEAWHGQRNQRFRVSTGAWKAGTAFLLAAWVLRLLGQL